MKKEPHEFEACLSKSRQLTSSFTCPKCTSKKYTNAFGAENLKHMALARSLALHILPTTSSQCWPTPTAAMAIGGGGGYVADMLASIMSSGASSGAQLARAETTEAMTSLAPEARKWRRRRRCLRERERLTKGIAMVQNNAESYLFRPDVQYIILG